MDDWKPIETAPRDGTEILMFSPYDTSLSIARWDGREWKCTATGFHAIKYMGDFTTEYFAVEIPTHWMPLPKPPKVETK